MFDKVSRVFGSAVTALLCVATPAAALQTNEWPLEVVVATNSVQLEDRPTLVGDVSITRASPGPVLSSNAELVLGADATINGSVKADTLILRLGSDVLGTARYNTVQNAGTIHGAQTSPLSLPLGITIPALPSIAVNNNNISLNANQSTTLAPGTYGNIALASGNGGGITKLTLSGGLYQVRSIAVVNDARIECASACEIRVQQRVSVGNRAFIGPKSGVAGLGAGNVQLIVGGTNGAAGPLGTPPAVLIGDDSSLSAYAFVPNGTLRLGHRVVFRGKILARDAVVGFDDDAQLRQLAFISSNPQNITVREGAKATFSVTISAGTGLSYQWQKNGVNIPGATSASYTTPVTVAADTLSRYRVIITNNAGTVTSGEGTLTVIPCASTDVTCDNFDDDCNGVKDEEYAPRCSTTEPSILSCVSGAVVVTTACSDGDACNGSETCSAAACFAGTPVDTDDANACTADACNAGGIVSHELLPQGTLCSDGNPLNGLEACDGTGFCDTITLPTCQGNASCFPEDGPTVGDPPTGPGLECSQAGIGIVILGGASATEASGVAAQTPAPGCPPVELFSDESCTVPTTVDALNAEFNDPNTPVAACSPQAPGGITTCPIDPASIRNVNCGGSNAACDPGEECIEHCTDGTCREVNFVCAVRPSCTVPVLADDPRGCAADVWDCSPPSNVGETTKQNVYDQVGIAGPGDFPEDDPGPVVTAPEDYSGALAATLCDAESFPGFDDTSGPVYQPPGGDPFTKSSNNTLGSPIKFGGDMFGMFIHPTLHQSYNVSAASLDHFELKARAQGALVAAVRVLGKPITVLDLDAHVFVDQCGIDTVGKFEVFGDTVAALPSVQTTSDTCASAFSTLKNVVEPLREGLVLAQKLRKLLKNDPSGTLVCEYMGELWKVNNTPWPCDSLSSLDPDPNKWPEIIIKAAINYYAGQIAPYLSSRADYVEQAIAGELATEPSEGAIPLFDTPFTVASAEASIPIGPIAIVMATSLGGHYGVNGSLNYKLEHGFSDGVTLGIPSISAGAAVTPHVAVDGSLYIGVGFDIGFASASIGVEGQVTFFDVGVPVYTSVGLSSDSFTDQEARDQLGATRDVSTSDWAGAPTGIPSDNVYKWAVDWKFGSRLTIDTLSGTLSAAARVRFLFFSKTFRKKLLDWKGPHLEIPIAEANFSADLDGFPIPSAADLDFDDALSSLGFSGEQIGFNAIPQIPGPQYQFSPDAADNICIPQVIIF